MTEVELLAQLLFAESSKENEISDKDATAIAWVVKNRVARPKRFGNSLEDVVYAPKQFSGVGSDEWEKVTTGKMTDEEQQIYKRFLQIAGGVWSGTIADPTDGADHYFNPDLANPSWAKEMEETYSSGAHSYLSELKKRKVVPDTSFTQAFRSARKSGLKEFTWNNKRYTTELK